MKNLLTNAFAFAIVMTTCFNCSVESIETNQLEEAQLETSMTLTTCVDQDPQARITNNGTVPVTLEIATIDGTILHTVSNLAPNSSSGYLSFDPNDIIFNVVKNSTGVSDEKVSYTMGQCMSFDMEVALDNYLLPSTPQNL